MTGFLHPTPQESVGLTEPKPSWCGLLKDGELMAEGQDLRFEFNSSSEAGPDHCKEGREARAHDWVNVTSRHP